MAGGLSERRRKGRLSGSAGLDRASIQQHLLQQADTSRETSLFFMDPSVRSFTQRRHTTTLAVARLKPPRGRPAGAFAVL